MTRLVHHRTEAGIGLITIDRPDRRNALNLQVKHELVDALHAHAADDTVAAIVLTGAGDCFVAGTDIGEMSTMTPTDHVRLDTDRVFHAVRQSPKPVIAAVEGYALGGGCELALACDIIVAADNAQFGQPEIRVGIMPGAGGTQHLLRAAGRHKTALWTLTGQAIPAVQAHAANLVSELVPPGQALARALHIGSTIAAMPPLAVASIREVLRQGADVPLATALALERRLFERLFDSQDQREGMQAFLDKRKPVYRGC